jgi:hypothetical protein
MSANWKDVARATLEGSESGATTFPQDVQTLMKAGFDGSHEALPLRALTVFNEQI